jgi:hypothetical protein
MQSLRKRPAESSRGALRHPGFGLSASTPGLHPRRLPSRLTSRSSRRRFVASLKLAGMRAILAPNRRVRRGLTPALGPAGSSFTLGEVQMPTSEISSDLIKDVIYAEYARLHATIDATVNGSFTDFATLAVLGSMFAWEPFARKVLAKNNGKGDTPRVLCAGFIIMLTVLAIIATRDLLKQSIVIFNAGETMAYEEALRTQLGSIGPQLFRTSERFWPWLCGPFSNLSLYFRALVVALAVGFPIAVLWPHGRRYVAIFVTAAVALITVYACAFYKFSAPVRAACGA